MKKKNKLYGIKDLMCMIKPGARIMVGGFGLKGYPNILVDAIIESEVKDLTIISNDLGSPGMGLGKLLRNNQIKELIGNYYNWNPEVVEALNEGRINVTLVPQGTMAEAIRAAGTGIPAFYTPTAVGTELAAEKEYKEFSGRRFVLAEAIHADIALIKAHTADEMGNLVYYKTAQNFNPLMAMAAKFTIAQVDEIVPVGLLRPDNIVTPHIFVDALVKE